MTKKEKRHSAMFMRFKNAGLLDGLLKEPKVHQIKTKSNPKKVWAMLQSLVSQPTKPSAKEPEKTICPICKKQR